MSFPLNVQKPKIEREKTYNENEDKHFSKIHINTQAPYSSEHFDR